MARSIDDERRAQSVTGMHDQGAVNCLQFGQCKRCGNRTHARAKFRQGWSLTTVDYLTPGRQKRRQNRWLMRSVGVCLFAYTREAQAMIPGRQGVLFVRQSWPARMRLDYERIQAIGRNLQASKARSTGLAVFRQRQAWNQSDQVRSLKRISHECDGRYPGRSGCKTVSFRSVLIDVIRIGRTIAGSSTVVLRACRLLDGA